MAERIFDLQPMSVGDILDRTVRIYRRYFLHALAIAAVPYLVFAPLAWMEALGDGDGFSGVLNWLKFVLLSLSTAALNRSISERCLGGSPTLSMA